MDNAVRTSVVAVVVGVERLYCMTCWCSQGKKCSGGFLSKHYVFQLYIHTYILSDCTDAPYLKETDKYLCKVKYKWENTEENEVLK